MQLPIRVRQLYSIDREAFPVFLPGPEPVLFRFDEGEVELRRVSDEPPSSEGLEHLNVACLVIIATTVSAKRKSLLDDLARGRMPEGGGPNPHTAFPEDEAAFYASFVDEHGVLKDGKLPPLQFLPATLQEFVKEKSGLSFQLAERVLRMVRWRAGVEGRATILSPHVFLEWSDDDSEWHRIWNGATVGIATRAFSPMRDRWAAFVADHSEPLREPLGHELFREAMELREGSPRSALLTLVTAAEVGVKQCVASLAPTTTWLVEHSPSPPIVALIKEYLPILIPDCTFHDHLVCPPPKALLGELEAAVKARNELAHAGAAAPGPQSLSRKFQAIRDLLWLLDYYAGHEWAMEHVSSGTRDAFPPLAV